MSLRANTSGLATGRRASAIAEGSVASRARHSYPLHQEAPNPLNVLTYGEPGKPVSYGSIRFPGSSRVS